MNKNILIISMRILKQFKTNYKSLFLIFMMPLFFAVILSTSYTTIENENVGIVNLDQGWEHNGTTFYFAQQMITNMNGLKQHEFESYQEAEEALKNNEIKAIFFFSTDFSKGLFYSMNLTSEYPYSSNVFLLKLDNTYPQIAADITKKFTSTLQKVMKISFGSSSASFLQNFVEIEPIYENNSGYIFSIAFTLTTFFTVFTISSLIFLKERISGTLQRLFSLKISIVDLFMGYYLAFFVLGFIQLVILFIFITILYGGLVITPILIFSIFITFAFCVLTFMSMGFLISLFFNKDVEVFASIPFITVIGIFLSTIFVPRECLNPQIYMIAQFNPIQHGFMSYMSTMYGGNYDAFLGLFSMSVLFIFIFLISQKRKMMS